MGGTLTDSEVLMLSDQMGGWGDLMVSDIARKCRARHVHGWMSRAQRSLDGKMLERSQLRHTLITLSDVYR